MDELDRLKDAWKSQDYSKHKVSSKDIFKMLHAKSSSYVKWIFYISIIEFLVINCINLFTDMDKYLDIYKEMGIYNIITVSTVISYVVVLGFIYLFYRNYKSISADSNAKTLMRNILKTRKTVKFYIYFNIGFMILIMFILFYFIFSSPENIALYKVTNNFEQGLTDNQLLATIVVMMLIVVGIFLLLYRLIYGILLRRLKKNQIGFSNKNAKILDDEIYKTPTSDTFNKVMKELKLRG